MNREAYVVYNFNCSYRNWRRFPNVTDRHVHCKSERWYLGNGVRQRRVYYRSLQQVITANRISPFPMTWVFFKVIHPLQAFPNAILRTFVQQMTKLQLTQSVARSLCYSRGCRASCLRLLHCILRRREKKLCEASPAAYVASVLTPVEIGNYFILNGRLKVYTSHCSGLHVAVIEAIEVRWALKDFWSWLLLQIFCNNTHNNDSKFLIFGLHNFWSWTRHKLVHYAFKKLVGLHA